MSRVLEAIGYHSELRGQDLEDAAAMILAPFLCLAMLVSVGLNMVLR